MILNEKEEIKMKRIIYVLTVSSLKFLDLPFQLKNNHQLLFFSFFLFKNCRLTIASQLLLIKSKIYEQQNHNEIVTDCNFHRLKIKIAGQQLRRKENLQFPANSV